VILSDGDAVFQPRKIERAGLQEAVDGQTLIYIIHKERELDDVDQRYPADHYVLVDDKLRILTAVKQAWGDRVTTIFPQQGHYAHDPMMLATYRRADVNVQRIGDLLTYDLSVSRGGGGAGEGSKSGRAMSVTATRSYVSAPRSLKGKPVSAGRPRRALGKRPSVSPDRRRCPSTAVARRYARGCP
jgi:hypothetical protein